MSREPTEKRQRQIAEAALAIIAREGLGRFTTAAIAAEIGIAEGTIFRHFDNKAAIVDAAVQVIEELLGEPPEPGDGDPIDQLGGFFRHRVELMQSRPGIFRILFSEQLTQAASADTVARIEALQKRSLGFIRGRLEQAQRKRLLRPGLQAAELFAIVHGSALALAFSGGRRPAPPVDPARVWRALELMIRR
jgi:AcrR family transcriptional regulator